MKHMKKVCGLLLALAMALSLTVTAFADDPETGSITINGVSADTTYEIYRLLDLESYNKTSGAYSYTVNTAWAAFFATDAAKAYFSVNAQNYATWIAAEDDATVAAFAKLALSYAKTNHIAPVQSSKNDSQFVITGTSGKFSDLPLGYYLVDSTAGALCGLTTTDPDASINAKNHVPTIDKQVQEDLTGQWGDVNTADIGQIVNYMSIIHVAAGAQNYVLHDKMSDGLTFVQDPENGRGVTEVKLVKSGGVEETLDLDTDYTVVSLTPADGCTFEVEFSDAFVESLKPNERIIVYYNAMLNRHALVGTTEDNTNESWLEYGENKFTTHDQTKTHTFSIDIVKTDSSNKLIDGAKFKIYDAATGGNEIKVVPLMAADDVTPVLDTTGNPKYRRARADEAGVEIEVKNGKVTVVGFDNGIYYLEETAAPAGYNKLTARKEFTIADANLDSVFNGEIYSTGSGVHVTNKTGTMLPETGGMGTVLFVTFGTIVVLGAGVLLVTKKRMSMIR
ncbi:MAG: SpaH/EbpB family LPXTG-anchored major pilin [Oscillibacter sp.]|nr:SpaH/EbpB family LPXTG-anchored major pilin [Oscillibacter sp.]